MLAAWYEKNGDAVDVLEVGELDTPTPDSGEVLVRVHFSGVNPSDVKARRRPPATPKVVPHSDGSGVIEAVGKGVSADRIGERVWLWNGQWKRAFGTCAQHIALPSVQAVTLPDAVSFEAGACFGIPLMTAVHAVSLLENIQQGSVVLVTGAVSSVGSYAAQLLSRIHGVTVIGTVGSKVKEDYAKTLGVKHTINYKTENVAERILALTAGQGVAGVVDMDFSTTAPLASTGCIANHSTIVSYGSNIVAEVALPFREFMFRCLSLRQFAVYELTSEHRKKALAEIARVLQADLLTHELGGVFELANIAKAHQAVETGNDGKPGKICVQLP